MTFGIIFPFLKFKSNRPTKELVNNVHDFTFLKKYTSKNTKALQSYGDQNVYCTWI